MCVTNTIRKIGITNKTIIAFDIQAVCSVFVYALSIANDMMKCNHNIKKAIVIGADKMSSIIDWSDRTTCVLFGDGAGAVVLDNNCDEDKINKSGIIDTELNANGNFTDILYANSGVSDKNFQEITDIDGNIVKTTAGVVKMNGQ